ncbi:hypothetical protein HYALB_00004664 [Hymenoscyphus albidus]|uniref:Uncharacterized protein n=1 Tax=Hymenoscyphus albidus TaxID=595503 RepID=A0A9N9LUA9_9HELO|nr:hypothetical protein HYALB_00004664 [Hymenoscyphus albidus]
MSGSGNNYSNQTNQGGGNSYYQSQDQYYQSGSSQSQSYSGPYFAPPFTSENIGKYDQSQGGYSSTDYYLHEDKDQDFERVAQGIPDSSKGKGSKGSKRSKSKGSKRR